MHARSAGWPDSGWRRTRASSSWNLRATESDNLAIRGIAHARAQRGRHISLLPIEQ